VSIRTAMRIYSYGEYKVGLGLGLVYSIRVSFR